MGEGGRTKLAMQQSRYRKVDNMRNSHRSQMSQLPGWHPMLPLQQGHLHLQPAAARTATCLRRGDPSAHHSLEVKRYPNTQSEDTSLSRRGPTSISVHACSSSG